MGEGENLVRDSRHPSPDPSSTVELVALAQQGDRSALARLFARHAPPLRRWASGRLPGWARDLADTDDVVQDALLQTFKRIEDFEARRAEYEAKAKAQLEGAEGRKADLEGVEVTITANASTEGKLYGSITPRDIAEALATAGTHLVVAQAEVNGAGSK